MQYVGSFPTNFTLMTTNSLGKIRAAKAIESVPIDHDDFVDALTSGRPLPWPEVLERLAPTIQAVVSRLATDHDEKMDLFVHVAEGLRERDLRRLRAYRHKEDRPCSFRTYVSVVATNLAVDQVRAQKGRFRPFKNLDNLDTVDQSILRYRVRDGLSLRRIRHLLHDKHHTELTDAELEQRCDAIESRFSASQRWRLLARWTAKRDELPIHPTLEAVELGERSAPLGGAEESPESRLAHERAGDAFRRALDELEPRLRLVLVLRYRDGLKVREVAEWIRATDKQVEHWAAEALSHLRIHLRRSGVDQADLDSESIRDLWLSGVRKGRVS